MGISSAFTILEFYTVITGMFSTDIANTFNTFKTSSILPIIHTVILISLGILFGGVKDGIKSTVKF